MSVSSGALPDRGLRCRGRDLSASSGSGSAPPSRCFPDARITARILADSAVSVTSGSLPRWPPGSSGAGLRSLVARSSSRNQIPCSARYREPAVAARARDRPARTTCAGSWRLQALPGPGGPASGTRPAAAHASLAAERKRARHRPGAGAANGRARVPAGASQRAPGPPGLLEAAARPYAYTLACISLTMMAIANSASSFASAARRTPNRSVRELASTGKRDRADHPIPGVGGTSQQDKGRRCTAFERPGNPIWLRYTVYGLP